MPHLTSFDWLLAIFGAVGIGVAKSGFSGVSMLHVLIFASLFGARDSTGVVLPMLIVGDVLAVCKAEGVTKCVLAGISVGSRIAMQCVLDHPSLFNSVILVGSGSRPSDSGVVNRFCCASRITRYWLVSVKMVETMRWPKAL